MEKNRCKQKADVITRKYAEFMGDFEQQKDDRRVAFNVYRQIIGACEAMENVSNNFVAVSVNASICESMDMIDEIITRFTGKTYEGYRWRDPVKAKSSDELVEEIMHIASLLDDPEQAEHHAAYLADLAAEFAERF